MTDEDEPPPEREPQRLRDLLADVVEVLAETTATHRAQERNSRRGSEKRRMSALLVARCTPEELATVQAAAVSAGQSLSTYVRETVLTATCRTNQRHDEENNHG